MPLRGYHLRTSSFNQGSLKLHTLVRARVHTHTSYTCIYIYAWGRGDGEGGGREWETTSRIRRCKSTVSVHPNLRSGDWPYSTFIYYTHTHAHITHPYTPTSKPTCFHLRTVKHTHKHKQKHTHLYTNMLSRTNCHTPHTTHRRRQRHTP
jgi:hypothetical protein